MRSVECNMSTPTCWWNLYTAFDFILIVMKVLWSQERWRFQSSPLGHCRFQIGSERWEVSGRLRAEASEEDMLTSERMIFFFFGCTGIWTQSLTLARQAPYDLSHVPDETFKDLERENLKGVCEIQSTRLSSPTLSSQAPFLAWQLNG
jgi:hypothetical protein